MLDFLFGLELVSSSSIVGQVEEVNVNGISVPGDVSVIGFDVVDDCPVVLEGAWEYTKFVLIEFPSEIAFRAWYESQDYQHILKYRLQSARCNSILVEGLE